MEKSEESGLVGRDVIGPLGVAGGISCGVDAGKCAELVGEVRLIVVSAIQGKLSPGQIDACVQLRNRALKTLNAGPDLGRKTYLFAEDLGESALAQTGGLRHVANRRDTRDAGESAEGIADHVMARTADCS